MQKMMPTNAKIFPMFFVSVTACHSLCVGSVETCPPEIYLTIVLRPVGKPRPTEPCCECLADLHWELAPREVTRVKFPTVFWGMTCWDEAMVSRSFC